MHKGNSNFILTIMKTFRSDRVQGTADPLRSVNPESVNPEFNNPLELAVSAF